MGPNLKGKLYFVTFCLITEQMFSEVQFLPARYRTQTFAFLLEWSSGARTAWIMKQRSLATGVHWILSAVPVETAFCQFPVFCRQASAVAEKEDGRCHKGVATPSPCCRLVTRKLSSRDAVWASLFVKYGGLLSARVQ